jgi:hypothetical protein
MTTASGVLARADAINAHDVDAMLTCLHFDYRSEQPLHPDAGFTGRDQVIKNWSLLFAEVPDLRFDVLRAATAGDEIWTEVHFHGVTAAGSAFEYRGMAYGALAITSSLGPGSTSRHLEVAGGGIDERTAQLDLRPSSE